MTGSLSTTALLTEVKAGVGSSFRVIRCRFIFSGKNDELTPDFFDTGFLPVWSVSYGHRKFGLS